jgi:predicted molibdopterin-dependent oxidoreductase YjgC
VTEMGGDMRVRDHPILGPVSEGNLVHFTFDGQPMQAVKGEPILAALAACGIRQCRTTTHRGEPRWFYCGIGRCTDCVMIVDGIPNVRTCVTPVAEGMVVETQLGAGHWGEHDAQP